MKIKFFILLASLITAINYGQTISGKITDDVGISLSGVNVRSTSSKASAVSDFDGNFKIKATVGEKLSFSLVGMQTITVVALNNMTIKMKETKTDLQEVVVVGYGTRKVVDATMSVAKVKSDDISKQKVLRPDQAVQGRMTGVTVVGSDEPGTAARIIVRGVNSVRNSDKQPLYVVDGVFQDDINNLSSSSIETFEVLKDASALAIYGNQAARGVVIITTKKGKGAMSVNFDNYFGIRNPLKIVKMASSNQYAYYTNLADQTIRYSQDQPVNTNWLKEVTKTATYQNMDLTISGSTDKNVYSFNANNYNENSIIPGAKYNRSTFRLVNDYKLTDKLKIDTRLNLGFTNGTVKGSGAITTAYRQSPIVPVYYNNGKYGQSYVGSNGFADETGYTETFGTPDFNNVGNPVMDLNMQKEEYKNINLILGVAANYKISNSLKYTANYGGRINNFSRFIFDDIEAKFLGNNPIKTAFPDLKRNKLELLKTSIFNWNFNNYITFNKKFGEIHDLELMGGLELIHEGGAEEVKGVQYNLPKESNYWQFKFTENVELQEAYGGQGNDKNKFSYFSRLQYKLLDRYLLTSNIRYDGSSQFLPGHQWGFFPSFGAGWVVSKENFLKDSKIINFFKIRGGWGKIGDSDIGRNIQTFTYGTTGYSFGDTPVPFTSSSKEIDKLITWETTRSYSAGFELDLFNSRLKTVFDYYDKLNTNIIIDFDSPAANGDSNSVPKHGGQVSNKGIEIAMNWNDKINDNLKYRFGINYTKNKNELVEVAEGIQKVAKGGLGNGQYTKVLSKEAVGQPLGSYYLWEYAGLDNNGKMLFYNNAGNKVSATALSDKDRKFMGSALPTTTIGIDLGVTYKRFDLSVFSYVALGGKVYNAKKALRWEGENIEQSIAEDFWTPTNTDSSNPAPFNYVPIASSFYLESGDFFRINNINLSYNLEPIAKFITGGQVYFNVINPYIYQEFTGFSPEISGDPLDGMGLEKDAYPTLRSFVLGIKLNF